MKIHLTPDKLSFSLFSAEQIRQMSVTKIITPLMLDALGHPIPGGLYDIKLGPYSDQGELCGTCNKTFTNCPGHFGYIELPLPTVNPLFHKIIGTILKISCLSCYHIQIPTHIKKVLCIQIKLLNCGLITEAMLVESTISQLMLKYLKFENIPVDSIGTILEYEQMADELLRKSGGKYVISQNTETLRNYFINQMLKEVKAKGVCMFCKSIIEKIQTLKNKIILVKRKTNLNTSNASNTVMSQKITGLESKYVTPEESRQYMRKIWIAEKDFLKHLMSVLDDIDIEHPTDVFYFDVIPVPPPNVRPVNFANGRVLENKQSLGYKNIIQNVILLKTIIQVIQKNDDLGSLVSAEAKAAYSFARGNTAVEKLNYCWEELQNDVNGLLDKDSNRTREGEGIKQIIEKKEGIIRMCMMGKRVNFSARSVITPDPNLNIDEIGVPEEFAKKLTYPVAVTPWNVEELRKMVLNGPNVHPGAIMVEYNGTVKRINPKSVQQQKSLLKCLLTPDDKDNVQQGVRIVHRHLCNGDILLLNRQPTLHKPSIMAHTARILKNEKTLRLHYANCKAYNADFDGDEMNAHFPQNELARSEGYNIVNVSNQFLVPKDGTPLSGLIQDHMIAGVRLSLRGRFFDKHDYQQLVYQGLSFKTGNIRLLPPTVIKPRMLWSGKQILSTVIINIIPEGRELISLTSTAKIPSKAWQTQPSRLWKAGGTPFTDDKTMSEAEVIIRNGELLVGILDKTHYGATPYGLAHCMYELYGGACATRFLSSLAKLFMRFLQQEGFTLGVRDILTIPKADAKRRKIIKDCRSIGKEAVTKALDLPIGTPDEDVVGKIEELSATDAKIRSVIDRSYKSSLDTFTNEINRTCLPAGLVCKFPQNNLQLMVQSGAKGSTVNTMQISCLLGQIELEGKRPPVMISGKSLPSFPAFEFSPRAGGFIDGRFMTGIQPQEFFFHCMAGREGLIDTAVKTSRSGYLQRCLIKHLEGLKVSYDMTVRNSDKSVIQFLYGEDGMDIAKSQFFNEKQINFLTENVKVLAQQDVLTRVKSDEEQSNIKEYIKTITKWKKEHGDPFRYRKKNPFTLFVKYVRQRVGDDKKLTREQLNKLWYELADDIKESFENQCKRCPDPVESLYQPDANFGAVNEKIEELIKNCRGFDKKAKKEFQNVMKLKTMQSMCVAGEPVGLLAAQSIGEPSTQMTLNTFHFAGRGEMNVTLGIPRLREILMMASKNIKTPSMEIPFLQVPDLEYRADKIRKLLTRVVVANVLETIEVTTELQIKPIRQNKYTVRFNFLPKKYYSNDYCVKPNQIINHMKKKFFREMFASIRKVSKINSNIVMMEDEKNKKSIPNNEEDNEEQNEKEPVDENSSSEDEIEDTEDAKQTHKYQETRDDLEPEDEEKLQSDEEEENVNSDEENEKKEEEIKQQQQQQQNEVVDSYNFAQSYIEDTDKHLWCEITFGFPLNQKKLDLTAILKETADKSVLWETPQIRRAITYVKDDQFMLRTDGINIVEMFKYNTILDLPKLYCNDIHKVAETYGIEAASKVIVKEVKDVFNVYGIKVDPRHLSLIADYMTFNGTFEPLSRKGMESSASPLQQMSFESSLVFLKNAVIRGRQDDIQNPSSSLMLGKPCNTGTGSFTLLHKTFTV
ncbi:DNA-directed RNA polymerase I subunit RPA1 [Diorhabda carinulata]|uniref:DNA-directed RNA polymerase I subunit RPA1 n=1 Tax=Diorhabda carinulata TaxID=1163345 RepID=UPI0025A08DE5|nr:DNA-directed RNA polymerase I subunit RPA1 [Diorhabda carinulata]